MSAALPASDAPVTSVAGAITRMEAIDPVARGLLLDSLAASTALASRMLLVAV